MLSPLVERWFSSKIVERGQHYLAAGKIAKIAVMESGLVTAVVNGTTPYLVQFALERRNKTVVFHASCTCPFARDYGRPCKHLWASVCKLDEIAPDGFVRAPRPRSLSQAPPQRGATLIPPALPSTGAVEAKPMTRTPAPGRALPRVSVAALARLTSAQRTELMKIMAIEAGVSRAESTTRVRSREPQPPRLLPPAQRVERMRDAIAMLGLPSGPRRSADIERAPPGAPPSAFEMLYVVDRTATLRHGRIELRLFEAGLGADEEIDEEIAEEGGPEIDECELRRGGTDDLLSAFDREVWGQLSTGVLTPSEYHERHGMPTGYSSSRDLQPRYGSSASWRSSEWIVPSGFAALVLPRVAAAGRLFISDDPRPTRLGELRPLQWGAGEPWRVGLSIESNARSYDLQSIIQRGQEKVKIDHSAIVISDGVPALVIVGARVFQVALDGSALVPAALVDLAPVTILRDDLPELIRALNEVESDIAIDFPPEMNVQEVRDVEPKPVLQVGRGVDRSWSSASKIRDTRRAHFSLRLSFRYGDRVVPAEPVVSVIEPLAVDDDPAVPITLVRRALEAELSAQKRLLGFNLRSHPGVGFEVSGRELVALVRTLMSEGWEVLGENGAIREPGEIRISGSSGIDWFEINGRVDFNGVSAEIASVLEALKNGQQWVVLGDGSLGLLPDHWLARHARWLELGQRRDGAVRFARTQLSVVDALLAEHDGAVCDEQLKAARERLSAFDRVRERKEPASFVGQLRHYQREGLGWLQFLAEFGFGGCLADDMGLGKTVQLLAHFVDRRSQGEKGPWLVVAPRSLIFNWAREAERFTPGLSIIDHTGAGRHGQVNGLEHADLVLTTYGTLLRDIERLRTVEFGCAILDEAQIIKNAGSKTAKAARSLKARRRLALTGTPVENRVEDLWSIFEFLNPGMFGACKAFSAASASMSAAAAGGDGSAMAPLRRALRPFLLRRTKERVAAELPARTEQTIVCTLDRDHRKFYDTLRDHIRASLRTRLTERGLAQSRIHVLEGLLRLRQAACHPGLVDRARVAGGSAKITALTEMIDELAKENHKVLIFSQFTSMLALVRAALDERKIEHVTLEGRTTAARRRERIDRFQNEPALTAFLISLKAGGVGLNLTAADHVVLLDPWWNPAAEAQAIDRTHRIGQTRKVFAYRIIAKDTVEERVLELQQRKRQLADAIVAQESGPLASLTREDLEWLLS